MVGALRRLGLAAGLMIAACASSATDAPAVLVSADDDTLLAVAAAIAEARGTARVEFGAGDPTETASLAVLPARPGPKEDRSLAAPTIYDIVLRGETCLLIEKATGTEIILPEPVSCRPLND